MAAKYANKPQSPPAISSPPSEFPTIQRPLENIVARNASQKTGAPASQPASSGPTSITFARSVADPIAVKKNLSVAHFTDTWIQRRRAPLQFRLMKSLKRPNLDSGPPMIGTFEKSRGISPGSGFGGSRELTGGTAERDFLPSRPKQALKAPDRQTPALAAAGLCKSNRRRSQKAKRPLGVATNVRAAQFEQRKRRVQRVDKK